MTITTNDILQHHGIKGMKWGVRNQANNVKVAPKKKENIIKSELKSRARELSWIKEARKADKSSTKSLMKIANRIHMENEMKRLTRTKMSRETILRKLIGDKTLPNKQDKANYRNRAKMSDDELKRKLARLRTKNQLGKAIIGASKDQIEIGKKVYSNYRKSASNNANRPKRSKNLKVVDGSKMENVIN